MILHRRVLCLAFVAASLWAQTGSEIDQLAVQTAGQSGSSLARVQRLVTWINHDFKWMATDYQKRTVEEIIQRRGGNCAELSNVLARLLKPTGIRYRWVSEINIHPYTPRRQETAARMVAEKGNRYSVFGLRHNDHRWLEVYDDSSGEWVPADPSIGVVGVRPWIALRMALLDRPQPAVPEVAEVTRDMIVPFAVVANIGSSGAQPQDRSQFYVVQEFNRAYGGRLASLPAWKDWTRGVSELSPLAAKAFAGEVNLHQSSQKIADLAEAYERLRLQARKKGLHLDRDAR